MQDPTRATAPGHVRQDGSQGTSDTPQATTQRPAPPDPPREQVRADTAQQDQTPLAGGMAAQIDQPAHGDLPTRVDGAPLPPGIPMEALLEPPPPELDFVPTRDTLHAMLENHYAGILLYDAFGRMLWASGVACQMSGYKWDEAVGKPAWMFVHPDDHAMGAEIWFDLLSRPLGEARFEQRILRKDGKVVTVEAHLKNLLGVEPLNCVVANYHDVSERKAALAKLRASEQRQRELAHKDHLTGLANRRAIAKALEEACDAIDKGERTSLCVAYVDLDGFKKVNDRLGHAFGDEYLRTTASRLETMAREGDLVARIGGDEFAYVAFDVPDRAAAEALGHNLVHTLSDPIRIRGHLVQLPACVGLVISSGRRWQPMEYLQFADTALYAAKQEGTGRVRVFDASLELALEEQTTLAAELAVALQNGELDLLYQPIVELATRRVVGVEGLLAWNHPRRGLLRAGRFISAAEETGLIIPIGEWVFDRACRDVTRWTAAFGEGTPWVSANLSPAQLIRQDFPDIIRGIVRRHGVRPGQVRLELTERGLFETEGPWRDRLWEAQAAGVPLMLDDFGTGYTSMRYLSEFPLCTLKLDRAYVARTTDDDSNRRTRARGLVRAVRDLATSMDMAMLAEGIETEEQHEAALEAGCHLGQGWFYARAMGASDIEAHLAKPGPWTL